MTNNMKIYFVLPSKYEDELSISEEMQQAFELCRQNQIISEWISEVNILTTNFNKEDIVVFETFEGNTFQQVKTRLRIVGPWCIITCLLEGLQVPSNKSPIFNLAMYKLTVTASNYTVGQKKNIKEKVEMMGGVFSLSITHHVTHLITNSVRTQKYAVANTKGVHVMLSSWIDDVWNSSLKRNVKATDAQFEKHKCPCFQNLRMSSTGFDIAERNDLQKIITENGGTYSGKFVTSATDILICKPGLKSEKFEVAKKAKVPCVRLEWIYDSEEKGFALPEKNYVIKVASSTPTKGDVPLNPDFSMMSIISGIENNDPNKTSVSATFNCSMLNVDTPQHRNLAEQKENQEPDLIAGIDLQTVRRAGAFLDGCGVLLAGFNPEDRDKLCRILKSAGATRYDTISDRVTHVLVGDPTSHEVRLFGGQAPFVSAGWLVESIRCGQPAPEEPYIIQIGAQASAFRPPSSPLSKKGLTLLQNDTMFTDEHVEKPQPEPEPEEHESIQIYKNNKNKTEEDTLAQLLAEANDIDTNCDTNTNISEEQKWFEVFENKTFKLIDQPEEDSKRLKDALEEVGGIIVENNFNGVTDYAVFPAIVGSVHHAAAAEVVSGIWILDCFSLEELVLPQYYHQLLSIAGNGKTLEGCVITISGYSGFERQFLMSVIRGLGGTYQDKFARIAKNDVLGNTHLVCLEEEGGKWEAAKRWNKYIVTHAWLLRCAETGHRAPENDYLLGNNDSNQSVAVSMVAPSTANKAEGPISPARLKTKLDSEDTKSKNTLTPCNVKPNSDVTKNIKTPVVGTSVLIMNEVLGTPATLNMERDSDSKRKSPESPAPAAHISAKISPEAKRKLIERTPLANQNNVSAYNDQPGEPMLTLEDGRLVLLSTYMNELRAAGVFDPPSPIQPAPGTPIQEVLARLRREGKIPPPKDVGSPLRSSEAGGGSQSTPVGRYLRGLQERNMLPTTPKNTPDSPLPRSFFDVKTPETPLGRFMEDDPSRSTRKYWQRYLDRLPNYPQHDRSPAPQRRPSTPWSEFKRQVWATLRNIEDSSSAPAPAPAEDIEPPVTESQIEVSNQIGQFQDMLKSRVSSGPSRSLFLHGQGASSSSDNDVTTVEAKDSQTDTVGWDEPMEDCVFTETETSEAPTARKFMISTIETNERANCRNIICSLGGEVSDLKFFDCTATHLICSNPSRNEKILSSMAAGTWILHHSYVQQSAAAGRFLPEEEYALGNPKSADNLASLVKPSAITEAIYWWYSHVRQTGKGAFHGMRAIVFSKNTEAIVRLIEAGGGTILQASPPFAHSIDITHCFLDVKMNLDYNDFIPLAKQGVPCVNILYLSNYLNNRTNVDVKEFIIPSLRDYYN